MSRPIHSDSFQQRRQVALLLLGLLFFRLALAVPVFPRLAAARPEWAWENNDGYDRIAVNWVRTGVYSLKPGQPTAQRMPLYPLLIAALYRTAGHTYPVWVRVVQALLSVWTGWLLYRLARDWAGPQTGAWALALFVLNPHANNFVFRCATETLFLFLTTGWLFHLARYRRAPGWKSLGFSGVYLGLAFLTRPSLGVLPLFLYPWTAYAAYHQGRPARKVGTDLLVAAVLAAALVSPWLGRNARHTGGFPVFQTWIGHPFYQGVQVSEHFYSVLRGETTLTERDAAGVQDVRRRTRIDRGRPRSKNPVRAEWEADQYARRLAFQKLAENPAASAGRWIRNLLLAPFLQMTLHSTALLLAWNGPLLALSFWGLIHAARWRFDRFLAAVPWTMAFFYFWAIHALVWPQARYLLPAFVPFTVFAAERLQRIRNRRNS